MDMYLHCLLILTFANVCGLLLLYRSKAKTPQSPWMSQAATEKDSVVARLYNHFMVVYILVIAADWLQAPFFWAVYREDHGLPEATVGKLSATAFAAGAIASIFVGSVSDKYGRRKACLAYCFLSALSCASVLATDVRVLYAGRALGGISTTLLYSAFDPWLLGEINHLCNDLKTRDEIIGRIFGRIAISNGIIAVPSGVVSEIVVRATASNKSPFVVSIVLLVFAVLLILVNWSENYGEQGKLSHKNYKVSLVSDSQTQRLGLVSFSFEASLYMVIYFWPAAINSARSGLESANPPPFGLIFANLMSAMMLGSTAFNLLSSTHSCNTIRRYVCRYTLLGAALSLIATTLSEGEMVRFMALCIFEACVGVYNPMIASLKGYLVPEEHRSQVYGLLRLPTNVTVVIALSSIKDGSLSREISFLAGSIFLLIGSGLSTFSEAYDRPKSSELV